ncbi:metal-dependent hydrolase family protein [Mesobacterium pallidum]|uniref:metal-dependent hydrolase family protein n=1 Tax=Mesobacterium pallidum TaxID=2872037 RepID=UPI001EE386C2|nr:amidohydrolase family protein [Mesobacterium pallidum]
MTPTHYALTDGHIVDVVAGEIREGLALVVKDGRIDSLTPAAQLPADMPQVSVAGRYLSPGLLDAHTHVFIGQFNDGGDTLPSEMTARAGQQLAEMVERGFTTVRDAGGADYGHKKAVEKGIFKGPRMQVSAKILSQTGGHGDHRAMADYCSCAAANGTGTSVIADGVDAVRKAVRENARQGVDQIKIMAGGGVSSPADKLHHPQYSLDEIRAITDEADRCGRYVMAHVYADAGIRRAVDCGVRSIEHGNFLSPETAAFMAERGAVLVPTLITYVADGIHGMDFGWAPENQEKNAEVLAYGKQSLRIAHDAGVTIGYGTDLCWSPKTYQGDGLMIHEEELGTAEALRCATVNNAKVLRLEGQVGALIPGAFADVLVLDANPLDGLSCFSQTGNKVVAVLKAGAVMRDDAALF